MPNAPAGDIFPVRQRASDKPSVREI